MMNPWKRATRKILPPVLVIAGVLLIADSVMATLAPEAPHDGYEITWLGDTFLGDRAERLLEENGYGWAFAALPDVASSDLTVVNHQAPLTVRNELPDGVDVFYVPDSPLARYRIRTSQGTVTRYIHRSSPAAAEALAEYGVDIAVLANNHAMDQGPEGLQDTLQALETAGIAAIGAGPNRDSALRPVIEESPYGRVAVFAFGEEGGTSPDATSQSAGICVLNETNVIAARDMAREMGAEWTVAVVRWGDGYADVVLSQEKWARLLAENDFNLVVGSGPHVLQRIEIVGRMPVIYSLGNFVFNTSGRFSEAVPGYGAMVTTVLGPRGFRELRLLPIHVDNSIVLYQPRPCDREVARQVLAAMSPDIDMDGAVGVLRW
ncbi:MAG: CapA family protein [Dehalococcoidia bacterium]|nr:CapA family protein [Dehalococcoidia bacterium]